MKLNNLTNMESSIIMQRTSTWYKARSGKFTASNFGKLMTNARNKNDIWSKTSLNYITKTATELYLDDYYVRPDNEYTEWGNKHEAQALNVFCKQTGFSQKDTGFIVHPQIPVVGATPDAQIIKTGEEEKLIIAQVKCPFNSSNHFKYLNRINDAESLKNVKKDYYWQMQGEMWISGANYAYFISFDPRQKQNKQLHYVKIAKNEDDIELMKRKIADALVLRNKIITDMEQDRRIAMPLDRFW